VAKFAPHKALKSIALGKLTFDEKVVIHRAEASDEVNTVHTHLQGAITRWRERLLADSPVADFEFSKNVFAVSASSCPPLQSCVLQIFDQASHGPGRR